MFLYAVVKLNKQMGMIASENNRAFSVAHENNLSVQLVIFGKKRVWVRTRSRMVSEDKKVSRMNE